MLFLWLSAVPLLSWYELSAEHQRMQGAKFQWDRHELKNYSYELEISAQRRPPQLDPIRIRVRDAKFLAAYRVDDDAVVDISGLADVPNSIEASYVLISTLLEQRPHVFSVDYDATWAYPSRIHFADGDDSNDEVTYRIRRFVPDEPR